jgi:hypothetical protein
MVQTASAPDQTPEELPVSTAADEKPSKKAKTERAPRPPKLQAKSDAEPKSEKQARRKRGPARPHRRLDIEINTARITKLDKRRLRAKEQMEDANRHVEGYQAERDFRQQEAAEQGANE